MTTLQEQIKLLQAVADGKTLQFKSKYNATRDWTDADKAWHSNIKEGKHSIELSYEWRIKPEPEVKWLNVYPNGSANAYISEADAKRAAVLAGDVKIAVKYQEVL